MTRSIEPKTLNAGPGARAAVSVPRSTGPQACWGWLALAPLVALALVVAMATAPRAETAKPNLVTILTAAEPQTQLMAMVLTMQSLKKGTNVDVLLCGPAGDMALKKAPASARAPQRPKGMSPQKLMQAIMQQGGKVSVCAIYLPNKGVGADALLDGIGQAKPAAMADKLLAANATVMSF